MWISASDTRHNVSDFGVYRMRYKARSICSLEVRNTVLANLKFVPYPKY